MREPPVADLRTRQVITVVPDTPFRELVGIMLAHDLQALPVIDLTGHPIGVVPDIDTLTKLEYHGGADFVPLLAGDAPSPPHCTHSPAPRRATPAPTQRSTLLLCSKFVEHRT
jgi:CBS-domain-containing membrane protein